MDERLAGSGWKQGADGTETGVEERLLRSGTKQGADVDDGSPVPADS